MKRPVFRLCLGLMGAAAMLAGPAIAQLRDVKEKISGNDVNEGIQKSLPEEIGAGRGNLTTQGSSLYIVARDPFRSIRRGRQLFQRKFLPSQGQNGRDKSKLSRCCSAARKAS